MSEQHYNKTSCDMVRVADEDAVCAGPPGAFCIEKLASGQRVMWHKLPDGTAGVINLRPVKKGNAAHPSWQWDGNLERPTLKPSVHLPGRWHGWFKAGRMVSC